MEQSLIDAAVLARANAYAPYSGYRVGAAILDSAGKLWTGCNIENVSYGLSVCAERTALFKMVSEGQREIAAVAVATDDGGTPCGMCLQAMLEFAREPAKVTVLTVDVSGCPKRFTLEELIPFGFSSAELRRT